MKKTLFIITLVVFGFTNCNSPSTWSTEKVNQWFEDGAWRNNWTGQLNDNLNRHRFAIEYHRNPERWNKAFQFLVTMNPDSLALGRTDILGDDLYYSLAVYNTRTDENARYETHTSYADIQYMITGAEQIKTTSTDSLVINEVYSAEKDAAMFNDKTGNWEQLIGTKALVFFPEEPHIPGIKIDSSITVKKIVLKVRCNQ